MSTSYTSRTKKGSMERKGRNASCMYMYTQRQIRKRVYYTIQYKLELASKPLQAQPAHLSSRVSIINAPSNE